MNDVILSKILILFVFDNIFRLIKHTGKLLEERQEKLCIKVLQTLKEMMSFEVELGLKVITLYFHVLSHVDELNGFSIVIKRIVVDVLSIIRCLKY